MNENLVKYEKKENIMNKIKDINNNIYYFLTIKIFLQNLQILNSISRIS